MPRGATVWLTGLPAAGKTTIGDAVAAALEQQGYPTFHIDGDVLRETLSSDLGFDAASRQENVRRAASVARILAEAGLLVVASLISPYRASRQHARERQLAGLAGVGGLEHVGRGAFRAEAGRGGLRPAETAPDPGSYCDNSDRCCRCRLLER